MKAYFGIIFSAIFALIFRILVEFNILEINSWTYLIIIPIIVGYIPFFLDKQVFLNSTIKAILFPTISVVLFLLIAFVTRIEDLGCFIILLPPYLIISIIVSIILRAIIGRNHDEKSSDKLTKSSLLFFVIPILIGNIEKRFEKKESNFEISQKVIINKPKQEIWKKLYTVPNLTNYIEKSNYNYFGFPNPVKSEYCSSTNIRLGYFDNGVILNESVIYSKNFETLTFKIDVDKSDLEKSQTFKHILENKNLVFNKISYQLNEINENSTELTLVCDYTIKSNIPFYGEFWSKKIIRDFEKKLLDALKKENENRHYS